MFRTLRRISMHSTDAQIQKLQQLLAQANKKLQKAERKAEKAEKRADKAERHADYVEKKADDRVRRAENKAQQAEERAKQAEERAEKAKEIVRLTQYCLPLLSDIVKRCLEISEEELPDIPEAMQDRMKAFSDNARDELESTPQYKLLQTMLKGLSGRSEKMGHDKKPAAPVKDEFANLTKPKKRSTKGSKTKRAAKAAEKAAKAAAKENPENPLFKLAADIADLPEPAVPEETRKPNPGRCVVKAFADRDIAALTNSKPECCPQCGSEDITVGEAYTESLRDLCVNLKNLASFKQSEHRACRCNNCGHSWEHIEGDLGVLPHRTVSQEAAVTIGTMNAVGLAVHKAIEIFAEQEQLGHETMYRNTNDWVLTYGRLMVTAFDKEWLQSSAAVADESPFIVQQSRGQGPCDLPEDGVLREKDYIGVKTMPFHAEKRVVIFNYLGGRSTEAIASMLDGYTKGTLITDAYAPYTRICAEHPGLFHQNCLAHLRRELMSALNIQGIDDLLFGEETDDEKIDHAVSVVKKRFEEKRGVAFYLCIVLEGLSKVYGYEKAIQPIAGEDRQAYLARLLKQRQTYSAPAMEAIDALISALSEEHTRLENGKYQAKNPGSLIDKAIVYYMNQRENFQTFLSHPEASPDSNAAELAIRAVAVIRKATNFKQSQEYMEGFCIWLSLVETAKAWGIKNRVRWLTEYGEALYRHRANASLALELSEGRNINSKLMGFRKGTEVGFDITPYLPWNYVKRMKALGLEP